MLVVQELILSDVLNVSLKRVRLLVATAQRLVQYLAKALYAFRSVLMMVNLPKQLGKDQLTVYQ